MSGDEEPEHTYKPRATRQGVHINGWRLSWYLISAAVVIVGNAFVAQHRIGDLEETQKALSKKVVDPRRIRSLENDHVSRRRMQAIELRVETLAEKADKVGVIDNRIKENTGTIKWHRLYEHSTHGTAPNTGDIDEARP